MLDLSLTNKHMIRELEVPQDIPQVKISSLSDPLLVAAPIVNLALNFNNRYEEQLYDRLKAAFKLRYLDKLNVDRVRFRYDLTRPLKRAMGNSFKHGNRGIPEKQIQLEAILTDRGAYISITDQGNGFNVAQVYSDFKKGKQYATYSGGGFITYEFSKSKISFANGGRTFLLLFLVDEERY